MTHFSNTLWLAIAILTWKAVPARKPGVRKTLPHQGHPRLPPQSACIAAVLGTFVGLAPPTIESKVSSIHYILLAIYITPLFKKLPFQPTSVMVSSFDSCWVVAIAFQTTLCWRVFLFTFRCIFIKLLKFLTVCLSSSTGVTSAAGTPESPAAVTVSAFCSTLVGVFSFSMPVFSVTFMFLHSDDLLKTIDWTLSRCFVVLLGIQIKNIFIRQIPKFELQILNIHCPLNEETAVKDN